MSFGTDGQPLASVIINVYVVVTSGDTVGFGALAISVGSAGFATQLYAYGAVPPIMFAVNTAELPIQTSLTFELTVTTTSVGPVIVTLTVWVQPSGSSTNIS